MPMMQEDAYAAKKSKKPAKVKDVKAKVDQKAKKIKVTWKKAKNAKKYQVEIKLGKKKIFYYNIIIK